MQNAVGNVLRGVPEPVNEGDSPTLRNATEDVPYRTQTVEIAGNRDAAEKVRRYQYRPGEELYAVSDDPLEWTNLADDPEHAAAKAELKTELAAWMRRCGDKGQQTELDAHKRQGRAKARKQSRKNQPKWRL